MAANTPSSLRNLIIYEIYVRNHTAEGTFAGVEKDLQRIKSLGVDAIWFMPIHPIGKEHKKGKLGCPYSIADYRAVNPEYGTLVDFIHLVDAIHRLNMKVMIDVVYNHTAHDSVLAREHPDFFHQDASGRPVTTVLDWSDVIDLKHPNPELSQYLIDSLQFWSGVGVDGFRCDVASLVPLEFWLEARQQLAAINPDTFWLAESVHAGFLEYRRNHHLSGVSDSELYQAFDLTYDYDLWPIFQAAVTGSVPVGRFLEMTRFQQAIYPSNYIKMHCVENHDQRRIMSLVQSQNQALAWAAFQVFNRGAFLIYDGQESGAVETPTLFDRAPVAWRDFPLQDFYTRLFKIKKHPLIADGTFSIVQDEPVIIAQYAGEQTTLVGLFNPGCVQGEVIVNLPDGRYIDQISGAEVVVREQKVQAPESAVILEIPQVLEQHPFFSPLLDTAFPAE